jgi:hypothetical protein
MVDRNVRHRTRVAGTLRGKVPGTSLLAMARKANTLRLITVHEELASGFSGTRIEVRGAWTSPTRSFQLDSLVRAAVVAVVVQKADEDAD